ncbi:MAG: hypothetical protein M1825_002562 [Sarcosagium campestre]|nr:MAG: hypothetical protein M1825_002562 [Sarcosagium campestre]
MSDTGRKGVSDQLKEKATPDSQKSTTTKISESTTSALDKGVAAVQPGESPPGATCFHDDSKSGGQQVSDTFRGNADKTQNEAKSWTGSAQDAASNVLSGAQNTLNQAADYVKGAGSGSGSTS